MLDHPGPNRIYIDRGGVGRGNVFQLVIIQHLYSVDKGVECDWHLSLIDRDYLLVIS